MACNNCDSDCTPCSCQQAAPPVMPRCHDVVLPDGTYTNATVVVVNGCIVQLQSGVAMAYQPDDCCAIPGDGGGGGTGPEGPPGPPGAPSTVAIGTVTSVACGQPATVVNAGTPTNAILNFQVPRGCDGEDGATAGGLDLAVGEWEFEDGLLQTVPADFPPIGTLLSNTNNPATLVVAITKDATTGVTTISIDASIMQGQIDAAGTALGDHETRIANLEAAVAAMQTRLDDCCPP